MSPIHDAAIEHLKRSDPTLATLIERVGPCRLEVRADGTHFDAVMRSIVYQQLSGRAAATILGRVLALYGDRYPQPAEFLDTAEPSLRGAGLSRQKIGYLRDLSQRALSNDLPVATLHELDDEALLAALTGVKGVGRWTAQMFMMFRLGRPNVLPDQDLGVRKAIQRAYRLRTLPDSKRIARIGESWHPHCSVASWYLWRSLELDGSPDTPRKRTSPSKGRERARPAVSKRATRVKSASKPKRIVGVKSPKRTRSSTRKAAAKRAGRSRSGR